jgi:hypothetical protein
VTRHFTRRGDTVVSEFLCDGARRIVSSGPRVAFSLIPYAANFIVATYRFSF